MYIRSFVPTTTTEKCSLAAIESGCKGNKKRARRSVNFTSKQIYLKRLIGTRPLAENVSRRNTQLSVSRFANLVVEQPVLVMFRPNKFRLRRSRAREKTARL